MATVSNAEVLPIAIVANDNSASAWQSFKRNAKDAQSAVDQLKNAVGGLSQASTSGITDLASLAKYARNPYIALALAVTGVGIAGQMAANDLAKIGAEADVIGTKSSIIAGLGAELKKVGGDAGDAVAGLKNLRTQLDLNSRDGGYLENLFKANDRSLTDAAGRVKPVTQAYSELAEMIRGAKNDTERAEIATNAFGAQAAPAMVKAILAGVTSLDKLGKTDLDPVVKQSRELEMIWSSISKSGDSWMASLKAQLAEGWGAIQIGVAAAAGNKRAKESLFLMENPNASRTMGQNDIDRFYNGVRGDAGATKTPSNRKDDPFKGQEFERAINTIYKHVAVMEADAAAVGKSVGEHEKLRVQAQLLDAAQRAGIEPTKEKRAEFERLGEAAKKAADNLAFLKLQDDVLFDRAQMGRSSMDQAISGRLRSAGIASNSDQGRFLAEQIRVNETMRETQEISKDALKGFIADLRAGKSAGEAFAGVLDRIALRLMNSGIDNAINALTGSFFGNSAGSGASLGSMQVGGQSFPAFGFHSGGIVGSESSFTRYVHPSYFDNAPRHHSGLMPDEFPAILQKGEGVFTKGQMAGLGGGMPQVNVTLVESADGGGQVSQRQNDNGGIDIEIAIAQIAAKSAATPGGPLNRVITSQLGGAQRIGRR